jgi:hypothetical protein
MNLTLELDSNQYKDLTRYCELNKFIPEEIAKKSYLEGFMIEKYGLLGKTDNEGEKRVEIEVIREKRVEVPVEVIKEVVKVEYVEVPIEKIVTVEKPVEKLVEVIKEVQVEKIVEVIKEVPVEKIVTIYDNSSENELLLKIQQLEQEFSTKTTEIGIIKQEFSTITTENENIFHYKMSKKDEELDELRRTLDEHLAKPPVEVVVEKETTDNSSKSKLDALQNTLAKVRQETLEKDKKIKELEQTIQEIQNFQENKQAVYLKGSNLDDKLYK